LAVGNDHAEAIDGAALEDGDEPPGARGGSRGERRPRQKRRREPETHQRERAVFQKYSSRNHDNPRSAEASRYLCSARLKPRATSFLKSAIQSAPRPCSGHPEPGRRVKSQRL